MEIQDLQRQFKYNSVKLADPNPTFSLTQVRDFFATVYPEIISADIEGPEVVANMNVYTFRRAVGTKGNATHRATGQLIPATSTPLQKAPTFEKMVADLCALANIGWFDCSLEYKHLISEASYSIVMPGTYWPSKSRAMVITRLHSEHCSRDAAAIV